MGYHQTCNSLGPGVEVLPAVLQACNDAVRFLDERKAGMMALLDRSVRDAILQHKVPLPHQKLHACMSDITWLYTLCHGYTTLTLARSPCQVFTWNT